MAICPKCRTQQPDDVKVCPHDGAVLISDEAIMSAEADLPPGLMVGEYRIQSKIGAGGFGTVYRAEQPLIGKVVAIKVLSRSYSSNPQMVSRFVSEARAVNQIRHRNIIDIFSFGVLDDNRQYFVMEYLDGMPFDAYLKSRGRLPPEEAIPILRQIAKALDAAHVNGIAHRDLKPENVFLAMDGDGVAFPKLLDFGIAKLLGDSTTSGHKTRTGTPIGTPYYMSPEQCLGRGVDHRADIYSFGVMVHEVLTGSVPFDAPETMTVMFKQMNEPPPPMSSVCSDVPDALDEPVLRMLAKEPASRPESASAGLEALAAAARAAGLDVTVAPVYRPGATPAIGALGATAPMTPAEQFAIASAKTMSATEEKAETLSASSIPTQRSAATNASKPSSLLIGAAIGAVVLMLGGVAAFFALRPDSTPPTPIAVAVTSASERVVPEPPESTAPAVSAAPAAPASVRLTIQSVPKSVEVFHGTEKLGLSPGPLPFAQSDQAVELTFRAEGYLEKSVSIVPRADAIVSVTLTRKPSGGKAGSTKTKNTAAGEIEDPFLIESP